MEIVGFGVWQLEVTHLVRHSEPLLFFKRFDIFLESFSYVEIFWQQKVVPLQQQTLRSIGGKGKIWDRSA